MADITGTPGNDSLVGTPGDDTITGLEGFDNLLGQGGNDILDGGADDDLLRGRDGNDTLYGGEGNDYVQGGEGDDYLDGGAGFDRVAYVLLPTDPQVGVTVDLAIQGIAQNTGHGLDTLVGIEHASGTIYSDVISGDAGSNWLWGSVAGPGGTSGDDVLSGRGGDDLLEVSQGNHTLDGGTETDTVSFFSNGDIGAAGPTGVNVSLLLQGAAQDTGHGLMTLTGIENLSGSVVDDILTGDAGVNLLAGHNGNDALNGGDGDDTLLGDGGVAISFVVIGTSGPITTTLDGGYAGDDVLNGGNGFNVIDGGAGSDTVDYADAVGGVTVALASGYGDRADAAGTTALGVDQLIGIENASGGAFADVLLGDGNANVLSGQGGDDILRGNGGDDVMNGGDGDDLLRGGQGVDSFNGGAGFDRISLFENGATSGAYVDLELQQVSNDGFGNAETLTSIEGVGLGTLFADTFLGSSGANFIYAGSGDIVNARGGDDEIVLAGATAVVDGGDGVDSLEFTSFRFTDPDANGVPDQEEAVSGVVVNLLTNRILDDGFGDGGFIYNVENVTGSNFDDIILGNAGNNVLVGLDGFDQLRANGGNDTLDGGAGDDLLRTGSGADTFIGGDGFDRVSFYNLDATQAVIADLSSQTIANDGFGNAETMSSIEGLGSHTRFADQFTGSNDRNLFLVGGGDTVYALGGDDDIQVDDAPARIDGGVGVDSITQFTLTRLIDSNADGIAEVEAATHGVTVSLQTGRINDDGFGGSGRLYNIENLGGSALDDVLTGDNGDNVLTGFDGSDELNGRGGDDTLNGGLGADLLNGGSGDDQFVYASLDDSTVALSGRDTIGDLGKGDGIDLSAIDANTTLAGDQAFTKVAAFTGVAGQLTLTAAGKSTLLQVDVNGDGVADMAITLSGKQTGFSNFVY